MSEVQGSSRFLCPKSAMGCASFVWRKKFWGFYRIAWELSGKYVLFGVAECGLEKNFL
jgi:hypothetical protein